MKTTPVASPHQVGFAQPSASKQADAKARAVAKLTGSPSSSGTSGAQQPQQVVSNQNAISVEEMGAIVPQPNIQADTVPSTEDTSEKQESKPKEDKDSLAQQYQQLARREKQLRQQAQKQAQELKQQQDAIKAKEAELQARETARESDYKSNYIPKDLLKKQTMQALADAGVPYDDIVQQMLNQQTPIDPRVEAMLTKYEAKIAALEQTLAEGKQSQIDQQTQQYQAAVKQIKTDVKILVDSDPEYEAIKFTRSYDDVVELITKTYDQDGILLTVEEASKKVEDYLIEEGAKLAKLEKIKRRTNPVAPAKPASQKTQEPQQTQPMKTLTNAVGSSRKISARERAISAFKGESRS